MAVPAEGLVTDAAHSMKRNVTEYQVVDIASGERLDYRNLGNQTVNIGEFLGVVAAVKYILENNYKPRVIYTDSATAIAWFNNKATASSKVCVDLVKAEVFLKAFSTDIADIEVRHWDNKMWGENPADFGNK